MKKSGRGHINIIYYKKDLNLVSAFMDYGESYYVSWIYKNGANFTDKCYFFDKITKLAAHPPQKIDAPTMLNYNKYVGL